MRSNFGANLGRRVAKLVLKDGHISREKNKQGTSKWMDL